MYGKGIRNLLLIMILKRTKERGKRKKRLLQVLKRKNLKNNTHIVNKKGILRTSFGNYSLNFNLKG